MLLLRLEEGASSLVQEGATELSLLAAATVAVVEWEDNWILSQPTQLTKPVAAKRKIEVKSRVDWFCALRNFDFSDKTKTLEWTPG